MTDASAPVEIFCCYSHADEVWLRRLETHLSLLKQQGLITLWHDRLIVPGADWAKAIDTPLETASVILLLVSADFLASDYCYSVEMKRALERHEANEVRVVPILVHPADWKGAPFAHLQALPTDAKPIAPWGDKNRALADVAAGIRRVIEDVPLLAASAPRAALPAIWNIPYQRNPFFLGREAELAQLRSYLQVGQSTALAQPQAISGLGGIGKSQLALEYAYRYHQEYQAVLWARAESTEALVSSYVTIATLLRLPERKVKEQDITVQAVRAWLQTHRGWLLILDNADELALVPDFLPPALGGHLILTTRAAATGRLAHRLEIETLQLEQGALFLLRRAGLIAPDATLLQVSPLEQELALQISRELGGLPLALDQAGAYLEETGTSLADYWQLYQQHRADLLRQRGGLVADHPASVATTWSLSFQRVEERNPAAADLLRLCAFLSADAIAEEILTEGVSVLGPVLAPVATDAFLLNQAIEALRAYSLVRRNPRERTLSIHRLVQAVVEDSLSVETCQQWKQRAVQAVSAARLDVQDVEKWDACERWVPHVLVCATWIKEEHLDSVENASLLNRAAYYLDDHARYSEAKPLLKRALAIREQELGTMHPDTAQSLNNLGSLYMNQEQYAEAEPLYLHALAIYERLFGVEHPTIANCCNNLALLYMNQEKYTEAEPRLKRALTICEPWLRTEYPDTTLTLMDQAVLSVKQRKYAEAKPLLKRALAIYKQKLGPEHPTTKTAQKNYASLLRIMKHDLDGKKQEEDS